MERIVMVHRISRATKAMGERLIVERNTGAQRPGR